MNEFSVAIIGGGASGLLAAAHLHRRDPSRRIALIERGGETGRGLAYGTPYDVHLLNVRAARMSAFADDDGHFANWLQQRMPSASGEYFAPRRWYGEYLSDILAQTLASPSGVQTIHATAVGLERDETSEKWKVQLHGGASIHARFAVLALGNLPPANPFRFAPPLRNYWQDPWANGAACGVPPEAPVFIVGTGLTMLDLVLALRREGHQGVVHALSRRGLRPHAHFQHSLLNLAPPVQHRSPLAMLRWLRGEVETARQIGHDWRSVMDGMRPHTRHIWHAWTIAERRSFLRHARPYWEVHRHRCAPEIATQIEALINARALIIHRGHIQAMDEGPEGIEVQWLTPYKRQENVRVVRVINCTGPASNYAKVSLPLIEQMRQAGSLTPDALHLGIETDGEGRLLGANGSVVPDLFAIGPLRRPSWFESIAIPEIREQAQALAKLVE